MTKIPPEPRTLTLGIERRGRKPKSLDVIKAQCKAQGLQYNKLRRDPTCHTVIIHGGGAWAVYNDVSSYFFGKTPEGRVFNSRNAGPLMQCAWMKALFKFFYEGE